MYYTKEGVKKTEKIDFWHKLSNVELKWVFLCTQTFSLFRIQSY